MLWKLYRRNINTILRNCIWWQNCWFTLFRLYTDCLEFIVTHTEIKLLISNNIFKTYTAFTKCLFCSHFVFIVVFKLCISVIRPHKIEWCDKIKNTNYKKITMKLKQSQNNPWSINMFLLIYWNEERILNHF